ncbi:hypothetical protein OIDMADRAFT_18003, partial [Oidiodendron maius Zn]
NRQRSRNMVEKEFSVPRTQHADIRYSMQVKNLGDKEVRGDAKYLPPRTTNYRYALQLLLLRNQALRNERKVPAQT